ncbi:MFS transporter [Penicillium cataractarum]|uniref:MFS transporter n=1 Tax=Penicillium cataractarum TaxID=2100454 RepID=A0A9W9V8S5_9EURO|nr:MFS transporter [Penicillium cataractarum]KAJ5370511.1 MFS transporter [Penicillium cataractarum]
MANIKDLSIVEHNEDVTKPLPAAGDHVMGTVRMTRDNEVYLIPIPTADPQAHVLLDPLNLPMWRKILIVTLLSTFSAISLSLISGFGGLLGFYAEEYADAGINNADITGLMTYPSAFMGAANLIAIPMSLAIGRRPVMLFSTILLVVGSVLCACAKNYRQHLAFRFILGLAAGQSEALVGMITQEIHFLHERGRALMIQSAIQIVFSTVYVIFASPIAGAIGPSNWYYLAAGLSGVQFILALIFLPETKYKRPLSAYQHGSLHEWHMGSEEEEELPPVTQSERAPLDFERYSPRTWRSDLRLLSASPEWDQAIAALKSIIALFLFPNVFWAFCLAGATLGINIAIGTAYNKVVTSPPYNWPSSSASYANTGQIFVSLIGFPLFGYGSDKFVSWRAKHNKGVHEPETRLVVLILPISIGILSCILFGEAGSHPDRFSWFAVVFANAGYYFTFIGSYIASATYLLDAYPGKAGPIFVIICALRGFIGFGTSFGMDQFIETAGYDGAFGGYAGVTAGCGAAGVVVYLFGKRIRAFTGKWAAPK